MKLNESEMGHIEKTQDAKYNATCIHCGDTKDIQLWPHRNGHGNMIGFVFACAGCADVVKGVWMQIHGIRGHGESESDTPLTDEVMRQSSADAGSAWLEMRDHARGLERKLKDAMRALVADNGGNQ